MIKIPLPFAGRSLRFMLAGLLLFSAMNGLAVADANLADPEVAVEAGKDALSSQHFTNWYDSDNDTVRPLKFPPPRKTSNWSWSWLDSLGSMFGALTGIGDLFVFLMWLVLAALVVWIVIAMLKAWHRREIAEVRDSAEAATSGEQISRVEALPVAIEKPMTNLLEEARRLAARGDYAQAIVYLFSHQLVEADSAGALRLRKGKTNRQYLRELRRNRPAQVELPPLLEATTLAFERAFFGAHPPSAAEFDSCLAGAERFDALLRRAVEGEAA